MQKGIAKKIGDNWSEESLKKHPKGIRWWESSTIHRHINKLVCGEPVDGVSKGLITRLNDLGLTFEHGVSVGFGDGTKEFEILKEGLVKKFTLFELSDVRIENARQQAKKLGFEDRVKFIKGDCFQCEFTEKVDFVHWNNSLHHMFDVSKAVEWSYQILETGGIFYMDDFVGPTRFQWSDEALELGTKIRNTLPDMYLKNPYEPSKLLNREISRPDTDKIRNKDPSEAADSNRILDSIMEYFPDAEIILTGGTIYHMTLNDILHNIDESDLKDKTILDLLLIIDELATELGIESHYAAVLGKKLPDSTKSELNMLKNEYQLKQTEDHSKQIKNLLRTSSELIKEKEMLINTIDKRENEVKELNTQIDNITARFYEMEYLNNKEKPITQHLISKFPSLYILFKDKHGIKNALINIRGYKAIKKNHLLDIGYYLKNNSDVRLSGRDPIIHYMYHGFNEGRKPNPDFDGDQYLKARNDVKISNLNPLVHYSLYGINEEKMTGNFGSVKDRISSLIKNSEESEIVLTKEQIKEKYEEIINKNASIVELYPFKEDTPLVSIIILNRNGVEHLKRLFKNFKENIQYPSYEIIVVDNASTDDSINFLEHLSDNLPLTVIKNTENKSFSRANNEAANVAKGEYILLLNNDVEPLYGWLNEMMQVALRSDDIGAVGAKLIYPDCSNSAINKNNSFKIQHMGIAFKEEDGFIKPYNISNTEPFSEESNLEKERVAVTAAALLVKKDKYMQVNGLNEKYNYGYEDVDLCIKLFKEGYKNIYCSKAVLFHYEFGTQEKNKNHEVRDRRLNNRKIFIQKWNQWLSKQLFMDKLNSACLFSESPLKIAFAVTESGKNTSAGDYFTALELGKSLKKLGWNISFLSRNGHGNWYKVEEDVDVLISLLDAYNPHKIKCSNKSLIKIAWPRNWFDRWVSNSGFLEYDIVLASSKTACKYIKEKSGVKAFLMPIATNSTRFHDNISQNEDYSCDYCFTGSYWNDPREIIEMLDPRSMPYKFKLYGKNWNKINKFKEYDQGFINYSNLPEVYASTKIVIDDANRVTKNYGAVNSRVYDALATGTLVLTNGEIGAEETFHGKLPVFRSKDELNELIKYYLDNESARLSKVKELQDFVLENHTYKNRANILKEVLKQHIDKTKIAIKIPVPKWKVAHEWGDYHIALGLKKEFEKEGCDVLLQILPEWDNDEDINCDVVIVLRGLSRYNPKPYHYNIIWNVSHPDMVNMGEYNQYDYVLIASKFWADKIRGIVDVPVETMLQCTDPELFYHDFSEEYKHDLLFVGNSRKVFRKIIKDLLPTDKDLSIYGANWEKLIDKKYIKGKHIPNAELRKAYSSCKILLNDHWDDMRNKGFISNRLFDGFACGAFIISDKVNEAGKLFGDALVTYETPDELNYLIEYYLNNEKERVKKAEKSRNCVIEQHTYQKRVERILEIIKFRYQLN